MRLIDYCKFKPATAGEVLFQFIISNIIGKKRIASLDDLSLIEIGGRSDALVDYYSGIFASNLMMRCIKKAKWLDESDPLSADVNALKRHKKSLNSYFLASLEIPRGSLGGGDLEQLANLVIDAYKMTKKEITETVRKQFKKPDFCYICGTDVNGVQSSGGNYELEHIWPQSYGGDSTVENLLPSCTHCNKAKGSMLLWQNADISSFVLMPMAENNELKSMDKRVRIARHRRKIFEYACSEKISLKEAAQGVGSVQLASLKFIDRDDSVDFYNFDFA